MKREQSNLPQLVESYFNAHLRRARGASPHTIRAYSHALRLFLVFLSGRLKRQVHRLQLDDIRAEAVLEFLDHLESSRTNSPATRNCRLAAIHGFVDHLVRNDVTRTCQYQRILDIRAKRVRTRVVGYLDAELVRAIIEQPDRCTDAGCRDYALILLLFNTGARVAEILGLSIEDFQAGGREIRVHGKGNKDRLCPLWNETVSAIRNMLMRASLRSGPLFRNARGGGLSRDGVAYILARHTRAAASNVPELRRKRVTPHVIRHSCAVALLQAGVDPTVIRDYLGHASVATTNRYIVSNLAMKRDALASFWKRAGLLPEKASRAHWRPKASLVEFLASL